MTVEAKYDPSSSTFTWVTLPKHSKFSLSPVSFLWGRSQVVLCLIALGIRRGGTCRTPRSTESVLCSSPAHKGVHPKQKHTFHTLHPAWGCIQLLALHLRAAGISGISGDSGRGKAEHSAPHPHPSFHLQATHPRKPPKPCFCTPALAPQVFFSLLCRELSFQEGKHKARGD